MISIELFFQTLKNIGYPEVDVLDDSVFDSAKFVKELGPFFELFSTLNEKNVLTTEEIEQYSALTPAELAKIEIWKNNGQIQNKDVEYEKKKEVLFLQEQLAHIESHNKLIEKQIDCFKKHEEDLLGEKERQQNLLLSAKKRFQTYQMNKLPQTEEQFISTLESILEVAKDLESLIIHSDASDSKLPTSNFFKDVIQQYLDAEEKILQCVNIYLQNKFELQENDTLPFIINENSHRQELLKEASFLQKVLKNSIAHKLLTENEIQKVENMVKYLEAVQTSDFNCHSSQLKYKLDDALKLNEQLKKKEHEMKTYVFDAASKHVDALLTEIDLCASNEVFNNLQFCANIMSLPLNTLVHQRARIELLISSLNEHKQELQVIRDIIQKVLQLMNQEKSHFEKRKVLIESKMAEDATEDKSELYSGATIISSLYKILGTSDDVQEDDITKVSVSDVVQRANKLLELKEECIKKSEEKMNTLDLIEKHAHCMESLLSCDDEKYSNWHELEQKLNVNLNNLDMKLASLEGSIMECSHDLEQKQKMLERKGNLRLARNLYVHALLNKELFKKCINDIKNAIENSADYK